VICQLFPLEIWRLFDIFSPQEQKKTFVVGFGVTSFWWLSGEISPKNKTLKLVCSVLIFLMTKFVV
jgi:hypothetical protein